jgi:hypothetical protein
MNIQQFLQHHGIARNPFAEEDAQTDPVFKEHCIDSAYHPVWDKVYGDPAEPGTSIVFGTKGAGKTAMRLQIERHLQAYNKSHPGRRVFVIRYTDFNPFLDHFRDRLSSRTAKSPEKSLQQWRLWDHMDAILCLGVTDVVDRILGRANQSDDGQSIAESEIRLLDPSQQRDLLLLAMAYDQSTQDTAVGRWQSLRRRLGYRPWLISADRWLGIVIAIATTALTVWWWWQGSISGKFAAWLAVILGGLVLTPYLWRWWRCQWTAWQIHRYMRVGQRDIGSLRRMLLRMPTRALASQPLPRYDRTDDRYALLAKFQALLRTLGFHGVIVLIDRVDEPHLTAGQPERMRLLVWPLLDNKLLKHPGVGLKMMLPQELYRDIERESREFHERARLDKQNVIPAFSWTGEALYDLARARMQACATTGAHPEPRDLFTGVPYERLIAAFQSLRVPRHLFRFLYRTLVEHCNKYTDADPRWQVDSATFESVLALYYRDLETTNAG